MTVSDSRDEPAAEKMMMTICRTCGQVIYHVTDGSGMVWVHKITGRWADLPVRHEAEPK